MNVAKLIDHTALKANTTKEDILKLIEEAKEYGFFSVCINPYWVSLAAKELAESDVKVCTVIGFPLGANSSNLLKRRKRNKRLKMALMKWIWLLT